MIHNDLRGAWLPPERAFVVQFYDDTKFDTAHMAGRVEHVVSGQVGHFRSRATLISFISRVLVEGERVDTEEV